MIEERDANPTADPPGRFRGRRAPTALTAGGTESSEVVARLSGTKSSNPLPSRGESANLRSLRTSSSAAFATIARQISTAGAAAKPLLRDGFRTLIVIPAVQTHPVIARGR